MAAKQTIKKKRATARRTKKEQIPASTLNMPKPSYWQQSVPPFSGNILSSDIVTSTVIIGGGLAGVTIGYMLAKRNIPSIILEAETIGFGETGKTTAHLSDALDDRYTHIKKLFGEHGARLARESHRAAIETIREIVKEEKIDCDFEIVPGYLFSKKDLMLLKKEQKTASEVGHKVSMIYEPPLPFTANSVRFESQAQFHPLKYLQAVAKAYMKMGGKIFTSSKADSFHFDDGYVESKGFKIRGKNFVVATNTPVNTTFKIHIKQAPYTSYVAAFKIPKGRLPRALFWDTENPYHYIRTHPYNDTSDLLIVGGEDTKTGQEENPQARYDALGEWTRNRFPLARDVLYTWSGIVMEPSDYLGYIGRSPGKKNVYIVTGDSGNGMTHCTIAGFIIPDLIAGKKNKYAKLYSPSRTHHLSTKDLYKENFNVAKQYTRYLKKEGLISRCILEEGEGSITSENGKKIATYRENDIIYKFSAVCPHLGCPLEWNSSEKSFDCTCHGSRFTAKGKVIHGPALKDLKRM